MLRSTLIAAGAALLCSASLAQTTLDANKVFPITTPIKNGGVINLNTGRRITPAQQAQNAVGVQVVFNNTCTWAGGAYYTGTGICEDYIDEGEIPNASNLPFIAAGGGFASNTNNVVLFQIGYCTNFAVPNITVGFYDTLGDLSQGIGGTCGGGASATGPAFPTLEAQACPAGDGPFNNGTAYYNLGLSGLPGDATPGGAGIACWLVGTFLGNDGFCIKSEADGVWDNLNDVDMFNWSWQMNDALVSGTSASGIILSGEPAAVGAVAMGGCTYNIPCNADPLTGANCGTGLGADDGFWINVDGDANGTAGNTGVTCVSSPSAGTTCYWFGGYPGNPFGSFWMLMVANGGCDGVVPTVTDCQIGATATQGCNSVASSVGLPSATSPNPFTVNFSGLNAATSTTPMNGTCFYGISGPTSVVWSTGISLLCVKAPTVRLNGLPGAAGTTSPFNSPACSGSYSFNFNTVIQNGHGTNPPIPAGSTVGIQAWVRDAASPKTTMLSDALTFTVGI